MWLPGVSLLPLPGMACVREHPGWHRPLHGSVVDPPAHPLEAEAFNQPDKIFTV